MSEERPGDELWRVFRIYLSTLSEPDIESACQQLQKEGMARQERDRNAMRLLFSSMAPSDLATAQQQILAERAARLEDRRTLGLLAPVEADALSNDGPTEATWEDLAPYAGEPPQSGARQVSASQRQILLACVAHQSDECDDRGRRGMEKEKKTEMPTFTISEDHNITAFQNRQEAAQSGPTALLFASSAEFAELTAVWPLERLVEIYNGIPGHSAIRRFADRNKAVRRIWEAIQPLASHLEAPMAQTARNPAHTRKHKATRAGKRPGKTKSAKPRTTAASSSSKRLHAGSKKAAVIAMMKRANGITLANIMSATGWQAHTVRGMISLLGSKDGLKIESLKSPAGERRYHIAK